MITIVMHSKTILSCTVVDCICFNCRNQMFDIHEHFKVRLGGDNPDTIFIETHIPSTILAMSEVIYPPAFIYQTFPHSSVLKRETDCTSNVHQPVQLLCMSFLCG